MTRLVALLALLALAAGCAADTSADTGDGTVTVVATVYPLAWLAEEIAPDAAVTSLAAGGRDPHALELSPGDRQRLEAADVVVYLGDIGFQPQVEDAVDAARGEVVAAADVVVQAHGEDALLAISSDHEDDGDAEHATVDPHLWFDPRLLPPVAEGFGTALAAADPAQADAYTAAAARVADELETRDGEVAELLDDCAVDRVVVGHEAYAYLLEPHGLHQEGVSSAAGHAGASPQRIAELADLIRAERIPAVLSEPVEGRQDADAVAAEAGVEVIEILSLDVVSQEQAAAGYPDLLREQAAAVARAAGCRS